MFYTGFIWGSFVSKGLQRAVRSGKLLFLGESNAGRYRLEGLGGAWVF